MNEDILIKNDSVSKFRLNTRPPSPDAGRTDERVSPVAVRAAAGAGPDLPALARSGRVDRRSRRRSRRRDKQRPFPLCDLLLAQEFRLKTTPKSNIRRFTAAP